MGQRGFLKDPQSTRRRTTDRNKAEAKAQQVADEAQVLELVTTPAPPEPPADVKNETVLAAWTNLWQADIARYIHASDMPTVHRLFRLYQEFEDALERYQLAPAVKGSQGQLRVNPFLDAAMKIETAIHRLENEVGLTPMARARLGLTTAAGHLTVEQINAMAERRARDGDRGKKKPAELVDGFSPA
jgi:P27 family predicted phage terminase small subunit